MSRYEQIKSDLNQAYDRAAATRDVVPVAAWKAAAREAFLQQLRRAGCRSLLEIGAGPGRDSQFFQESGLQVTAGDLSLAMARLCRAKGVPVVVMNLMVPSFARSSFDAAYAFNSLLHVPRARFAGALTAIRRVLRPGAYFFLGVYGGRDEEGVWAEDSYRPQRFFSFFGDEAIQEAASQVFVLLEFQRILLPDERSGLHFQQLLLRKA